MADLESLLTRGLFAKELPPPFKTLTYGQAVLSDAATYLKLSKDLKPARLAIHNLARPGTVHRRLGIPNPAPYLLLVRTIVDNWTEISTALAKSPLSLSSPTLSPIGRALNPAVGLGELPERRANVRAGGRFSLLADVARFYPSIYSHSIPWALHTKATSKKNKGLGLLGNVIDRLVRACQDGQTVGIPIGPDTSLVISELLMSAVDVEIAARLGGRNGFRYIDDFEFVFPDAASAEAALGPLQEVLGQYELALNPDKTRVRPLPQLSEERWIAAIRKFKIRTKKADQQRRDLIGYFDIAFDLAKEFPTKTVLNYAVAALRSVELDPANTDLAQDLLLQSLVNEAGVARFALEMLIRWRAAKLPLDDAKTRLALDTMIHHHTLRMHGSEVAWALWGAIALDIVVADSGIQAAVRMDDPVVSLLALDCQQRGLTNEDVSAFLVKEILEDSYCSERWLLLYEAVRRNWLPKAIIVADEFVPFFDTLASHGVSFYDPDTEIEKIRRPLDKLHGLQIPVVGFVFGY